MLNPGFCAYEECIISTCRVVFVNKVYSVSGDSVWDFLMELFTVKINMQL